MWRLATPELQSARDDVQYLIQLSLKFQNKNEVLAQLDQLYQHYHENGGFVTDEEHDKIPSDIQEELLDLYEHSKKALRLIRPSLMSGVAECPYCSLNEACELDHFMPKAKYKALSLCRLNLVPVCSTCNRKKSDRDYRLFIHPYYLKSEVKNFLSLKVTLIDTKLFFELDVSPRVNPDLKSILDNHINVFNLRSRFQRRINAKLISKINAVLYFIKLFEKKGFFPSDAFLKEALKAFVPKTPSDHDNWDIALYRGLIDCDSFTLEVAKNISNYRFSYVKTNKPGKRVK